MFPSIFRDVKPANCLIAFFSSAFLAFGLCHVHSMSGVTEGGVLGLTLLLEHWFDISPSVSGMILNFFCYALGWRLLGKSFSIATVGIHDESFAEEIIKSLGIEPQSLRKGISAVAETGDIHGDKVD